MFPWINSLEESKASDEDFENLSRMTTSELFKHFRQWIQNIALAINTPFVLVFDALNQVMIVIN